MKKIFFILTLIISVLTLNFNSNASQIKATDNEILKEIDSKNTLYIELKDGIVIVELFPQKAPGHVARIRDLTKDGFYDNLKFHRVIDGFMAQTGDPTGTGRGGSKYGKLYAEFNDEHHTRGTLSMARASDPNSANSQFFIVTGEFFPELDKQYTVFGKVIEGMEYIDKIKAGDTSKNGMVDNPDIMVKVVTGDMLNSKSIDTIKNEIKIVNDIQNEKIKQDSNYKKKSILSLLLETKNIDSNETETPKGTNEKEINGNKNSVNSTETEKGILNDKTKTNSGNVPSSNKDSKSIQRMNENINDNIDIPQPYESNKE